MSGTRPIRSRDVMEGPKRAHFKQRRLPVTSGDVQGPPERGLTFHHRSLQQFLLHSASPMKDIVPVNQIVGIAKLVKVCLPKVQCFCDFLTSPPSERQKPVAFMGFTFLCFQLISRAMAQRLANLLMLILLQGEISSVFSIPENENSAVISNSEDIDEGLPVLSHPNKAFLPPCDDNGNVRRRKSLRKRSLGRAVNIPAEAVESVANTPISALSPQVPAIQKEILDVHNKYRSQAAPGARNMLKMVSQKQVKLDGL
ncbi:unnamed protein product [Ranitomeya imitator]|uniref:Uncharacterized protein n=1 Tax=Ranitomeya imitator TaxID=111125 RepID=A0ABN9M512_9NEOB|nr:unnamed protein product [Ranitomeya imitator]